MGFGHTVYYPFLNAQKLTNIYRPRVSMSLSDCNLPRFPTPFHGLLIPSSDRLSWPKPHPATQLGPCEMAWITLIRRCRGCLEIIQLPTGPSHVVSLCMKQYETNLSWGLIGLTVQCQGLSFSFSISSYLE